MTNHLAAIRRGLRAQANAKQAQSAKRYFKTGKGEYGEGDRFLGLRVPALRAIARAHREASVADALALLRSEWHEERAVALLLLVHLFAKGDEKIREQIYRAYLANTRCINNWDLVDVSAPHIVGAHLGPTRIAPLVKLARSKSLWERRIAILATQSFIRQNRFAPTLRIAEMLLDDDEDLIHKAVGWMLREVGSRDQRTEELFLLEHYHDMPRTMLRYAIEKFPAAKRKAYLAGPPD